MVLPHLYFEQGCPQLVLEGPNWNPRLRGRQSGFHPSHDQLKVAAKRRSLWLMQGTSEWLSRTKEVRMMVVHYISVRVVESRHVKTQLFFVVPKTAMMQGQARPSATVPQLHWCR